METFQKMSDTINYQNSIIVSLKAEKAQLINETNIQSQIKTNEKYLLYYTGLSSYNVYHSLFIELEQYMPENQALDKMD